MKILTLGSFYICVIFGNNPTTVNIAISASKALGIKVKPYVFHLVSVLN
jgi:hypothetical protein